MTDRSVNAGILFAAGGFVWWGIAPIYFKAVAAVPAGEILAHRVLWSLLLLAVILAIAARTRGRPHARNWWPLVRTHIVTAVVLSLNWLIFIYAIQTDRLLEASLGYFINPLISILLGVTLLNELLTRRQIVAIALAASGIALPLAARGEVSWIALTLAASFALYGLLRKRADTDALTGLFIETLLMTPFAVVYLLWLGASGTLRFGTLGAGMDGLLMAGGIVTTVPLILFLEGARRLRLSTIGLMQYLAPSMHFLLAVVLYGEAFDISNAWTFGCIWLALIVYSSEAMAARRRTARAA